MRKSLILLLALTGLGLIWFGTREHGSPHEHPGLPANGSLSDSNGTRPEGGSFHASRTRREAETLVETTADLASVDRERELHGRVLLGRSGRPVAGAVLRALRMLHSNAPFPVADAPRTGEELARTTSAGDGTFRLSLELGRKVALHASHGEFSSTLVPSLSAGEYVEVRLHAPARLDVLLMDEGNAPVSDGEVRLEHSLDGLAGRAVVERSDAGGRASFHELAEGTWSLRATHATHGSNTATSIRLTAGEQREIRLVLPAGRTLTGRVTDAMTGMPIADATVGAGWLVERPKRTDAEGWYSWPGWVGGFTPTLTAIARGYGPLSLPVPPSGPIDFALERGDAVRGKVQTHAGEPAIGADVHLVGKGLVEGVWHLESRETRTDATGGFWIDSLSRKIPHDLVVMARGHGLFWTTFPPHGENAGTIDLGTLRLSPARVLVGVVRFGDAPLARVPVNLTAESPKNAGDATEPPARRFQPRWDTRTDDLGRFHFVDLAGGVHELRVQPEGLPEKRLTVDVQAERGDPLVITYEKGDELHVHVRNELGEALEGIRVYPALEGIGTARTDAEGRAAFRSLPPLPENLELRVWDPTGLHDRNIDSRPLPTNRQITIMLRRPAVIEGVVVDEFGERLAGIHVRTHGARTETGAFTDSEGRFYIQVSHGETVDIELSGRRKPDLAGSNLEETAWRGEWISVTAPASGLILRASKRPS